MTQKQLFLKKLSNYSIEQGTLLSHEFKNFMDEKFEDHKEMVTFLEDNLIYINSFLICNEYFSETEHCDVIASIPQEPEQYKENTNIKYNSNDDLLISKKADVAIQPESTRFDVSKIASKIKQNFTEEKEEPTYTNNIETPEVSKIEESEPLVESEYTEPGNVQIIKSYNLPSKKHEVNDFVRYFISRYKVIGNYLRKRSELGNHLSIAIILKQPNDTDVSLIGMVKEISETRNKNIMLTIEDVTGEIRVIFSRKDPKINEKLKNLIVDEIIGIKGRYSNKIMFGSDIIFPDIPYTKELVTCKEDIYMVVLSDVHVGSTYFLENEFEKFLKWIRGEAGGPKQKEVSKKIKYIVIAGDLVDGVGIYPKQKSELTIPDIYGQYEKFTEYLKQIPEHIQIVICPGNHDALRIAEPQPPIPKEVCQELYNMPNVYMVSSPSYVKLHASEEFEGFDVLLYHGYSFDYYYTQVESLRNMGAMHKPQLISRFLLQKRHLAPSHTSTLYIPDAEDSLIIQRIPDFMVTGHIHTPGVINYRNTTIISGSCFQAQTDFQVKVGHEPEPAKVPIVNLRTRKVKILKFVADEE